MNKTQVLLILAVISGILAIAGIIYDFVITHGQANVIVAILPTMMFFYFLGLYRKARKDD